MMDFKYRLSAFGDVYFPDLCCCCELPVPPNSQDDRVSLPLVIAPPGEAGGEIRVFSIPVCANCRDHLRRESSRRKVLGTIAVLLVLLWIGLAVALDRFNVDDVVTITLVLLLGAGTGVAFFILLDRMLKRDLPGHIPSNGLTMAMIVHPITHVLLYESLLPVLLSLTPDFKVEFAFADKRFADEFGKVNNVIAV